MEAQRQQQRRLDLFTALLACNQAIIRSQTKAALFEGVCQPLVNPGGMQLVWVGMCDTGDQRLWPQAHSGEGLTYLDWIRHIHDVQQLPGQGLAGAALSSQMPQWVDDALALSQAQAQLLGLPDAALQPTWRSLAAIPLRMGDAVCGVLSLCSAHVHAFDETTCALLLQLADNISAALHNLERASQRQQGEFALLESEVRYNALFASNPMPLLVVDPGDGRVVDANIRAMNFYGWDHTTITSKNLSDINILSPDATRAEMARAVAQKRSYFEFQHRLANGELRDVEVFTSPLSFNGQTYLVSAIHDVTQRHLLQAQVQQSQSLMQRFIDQLPGTAFVKDSQLRLLMANRKLGALLGVEPATLIGKTAHQIFPTDFADLVTQLDREVLEAGDSRVFEEAYQGRHNETSMFVIDDGAGQRYLAGLSLDITDQHRSKERNAALLRLNELAGELSEKDLLNTGLEMAERLTNSGIGFLHFVNEDQETLELVTWTAGALKGCTAAFDSHYPVSQAGIWADCLRKHAPVVFNDYAAYAAKNGLPAGHAPIGRLITAPVIEGGQVRMIMGVGNKDTDYQSDDVDTMLLLGNDLWRITRRARLEASLKGRVAELVHANQQLADMQLQLLQSEKMASIGQLASGVAHEINNPIGFVKSNLGSLQGYVDKLLDIVKAYEALEHIHGADVAPALAQIAQRKEAMDYAFVVDDVKTLIEESTDGVQRVSKIVQDLKNFSRTGDVTVEAADLQAGIESTINVVWNQLKYKVDVVRDYQPLPPVRCVISQINQVVMNLLVNAEQAIAERGTITVRTGTQTDAVWFEIQDSGCGIAADKLTRIFEPFYTSKPVGKGTGLGLSISFGIVQRHGGTIAVRSEPGVGSTFRVTLPLQPPIAEPVP